MFSFLKNHPFPVEAFFESSMVISFAVPREELQHLIPPCLELDTFQEKWGFLAAAMVKTRKLRPKGFPSFMGNDFFLIGYRVFVRYTNNAGKRLRGLYILKSETDRKRMQLLGNFFTHYRYTVTDVDCRFDQNRITVHSASSGLQVVAEEDAEHLSLPEGTPFSNWKEARRFAGPLPHTFYYDEAERSVLIIEGVRENWIPTPLHLLSWKVKFIEDLGLKGLVPASAFIIRDIPYHWKKGKREQWKP